jgi:hypothetical protein
VLWIRDVPVAKSPLVIGDNDRCIGGSPLPLDELEDVPMVVDKFNR